MEKTRSKSGRSSVKNWKPIEKVVEQTKPIERNSSSVIFKCIVCFEPCDVMYEGTSYCQECLKEKLRTGF